MDVWGFIIEILPGILACIPLVIALINFVKKAVQGKRWDTIVGFVLDQMVEAEKNYSSGAQKKEVVMAAVITSADSIGYPLTESDIQKISDMIDDICSASKVINVSTPDPAKAE